MNVLLKVCSRCVMDSSDLSIKFDEMGFVITAELLTQNKTILVYR